MLAGRNLHMELNEDNLEIFAAKNYSNNLCLSKVEFFEDLGRRKLVRKMVKKFADQKSTNIRLFCNHVITFTNNFEIEAAKKILLHGLNEKESAVLGTVFTYLGYTSPMEIMKYDLFTAKALKEMDK